MSYTLPVPVPVRAEVLIIFAFFNRLDKNGDGRYGVSAACRLLDSALHAGYWLSP